MERNRKYHLNNDWIKRFNQPLVISGPCSAESEEQMLNTAKKLNKNYIPIFRSGVWKPRTTPNTFEGVGSIGLKWLQKVKKETGMMVATEVANYNHVKEALKYNIDIFWIGARSTVNPFTVQEIAESLKGTEKLILVKNPIHLDLDLWIGALARLLAQGIKNLGVIHRGFYSSKNIQYRNSPQWNMIIYFKNQYPKITIVCDPSHICGKREGIEEIIRKYRFFEYDGLMVETHSKPKKALSDSKQQILPEDLLEILKQIKNVKIHPKMNVDTKIKILRTQIDEIDQNIMILLAKRTNCSKNMGNIKKKYNINVFQPNRRENLLKKFSTYSKTFELSENYIKNLFHNIHEESINIQNQIINKD